MAARCDDAGMARSRDTTPAALTYPDVGATARDDLLDRPPAGYRAEDRWAVIGTGSALFERAGDDVQRWGMQRGAGIRIRTTTTAEGRPVAPGDEAALRIGWWPADVPVRVVYVVDEPRRRGFAYGTLPGHPESGEELFEVVLDPDGTVRAHVRAFSRPGIRVARLGAPVARRVQEVYTRRYLRALPLSRDAR